MADFLWKIVSLYSCLKRNWIYDLFWNCDQPKRHDRSARDLLSSSLNSRSPQVYLQRAISPNKISVWQILNFPAKSKLVTTWGGKYVKIHPKSEFIIFEFWNFPQNSTLPRSKQISPWLISHLFLYFSVSIFHLNKVECTSKDFKIIKRIFFERFKNLKINLCLTLNFPSLSSYFQSICLTKLPFHWALEA